MIFRVLYEKFRPIIPRTLLAFLQLSLTWWSHLKSLEIRMPRSRCRLTDVIWLPSIAYWWLRLWHPKCMTVHFEVLKGIIHLSDHSANLFISSWSCSRSSGLSIRLQSLVSSANLEMRLVIPVSMSLMKIRNSTSPSTLSCGTPEVTGTHSEHAWPMHTRCLRPESQERIQCWRLPLIPSDATLSMSRSCGTLSNAFWKSRYIKSTALHSSYSW